MTDEQNQIHEDCDCGACLLMTAMGGISIIESAYFLELSKQVQGENVDWKAVAEKVVAASHGVGALIMRTLRQLTNEDDEAEAPSNGVAPMTMEQLNDLMNRGMTDE